MLTGHDIALSLRAAYLAMHRQTNAHLSRFSVTADQFVLLNALAGRDGVTQQQLVRVASSDPNTIRSMLVLIERRGFVRRATHPKDRRARCVTITPKGRRIYERLSAALTPLRDRLSDLFVLNEAEALIQRLDRIAGALARPVAGRRQPKRLCASQTSETSPNTSGGPR